MGLAALATHPTLLGLFLLLAGLGFGGVARSCVARQRVRASPTSRPYDRLDPGLLGGWLVRGFAGGGLFAQQLGWRGLSR